MKHCSTRTTKGMSVTSPIELVTVACPTCDHTFEVQYRASFNLELDPWVTDDYIESMTTARCPECETRFEVGPALVVDGDSWSAS